MGAARLLRALAALALPALAAVSCAFVAGIEEALPAKCFNECGGECGKCDQERCNGDDECWSSKCDDGVCSPATCNDGIFNGHEMALDCGATDVECKGCKVGQYCEEDANCNSGVCGSDHACSPAQGHPGCGDDKKNGEETDVDCGGTVCLPCGEGSGCEVDADCETEVCDAGTCVDAEATCNDGVPNGSETDVDCGGNCPEKCAPGFGCKAPDDCTTGHCDAISGKCQPAECSDLLTNGEETDVDCGGGGAVPCDPCSSGKMCVVDQDCKSMLCEGGHCTATCGDGEKNQGESDVDCGGVACLGCEDGKICNGNSDCDSLVCMNGHCAAPSCNDGKINGGESDIDCGQVCPNQCVNGQVCYMQADCEAGSQCVNGVCRDQLCIGCPVADCGGCAGDPCGETVECWTGVCNQATLTCGPETCLDSSKNFGETDIDCGGPCPGCLSGHMCTDDADCASMSCVNDVCT